jgi:hypothetical protein
MDLQEVGLLRGKDWIYLGQDRVVAGSCERGKEPSGPYNSGNFLTG